MQSETGFPSSHQLKSYVAFKSHLKLAARAVLSADAGLLVKTGDKPQPLTVDNKIATIKRNTMSVASSKIDLLGLTCYSPIELRTLTRGISLAYRRT